MSARPTHNEITLDIIRSELAFRIDRANLNNGHLSVTEEAGKINVAITQHLAGEKPAPYTITYPADWWQAFKERWFPAFARKRFPVTYTKETVSFEIVYPFYRFVLPHDRKVIRARASKETMKANPL